MKLHLQQQKIIKIKETVVLISVVLLVATLTYGVYILLEPNRDLAYEKKITEEMQAVNVKFDKKIIESIEEKEKKRLEEITLKEAKNPFVPY